jgi:predicted MPP superfamily phosphohydrolase
MSRAAQLAAFIAIALSIVALLHWYVWTRLVADLALPPGLRRALTLLVLVLFACIPLAFYAARAPDFQSRRLATLPGYVWLGVLFILFSAVASIDVVRIVGSLLQRLAADVPPSDPERRVTVARLLAATVALVGGGASLAAIRSGLGPVMVKEVRVRLDRLPQSMHGTTIVQITDLHVGPTLGRAFVADIVRRVNALTPDLIAITGDLVDGSVRMLAEHVAPLAELKARHGTYFVTGNHEYYSDADSWCDKIATLGIRVLRNERVAIEGENGAAFDLAGVDDHSADRFGGASNVEKAVEGRDPNRELVLLAHQPRAVFEADKHGVGLQLSGHTHGGQIWPWKYFVYLQQPVVAGLARIGRTLVYVSCGTGYWGPPMRLGAPAEITRIVLESGTA